MSSAAEYELKIHKKEGIVYMPKKLRERYATKLKSLRLLYKDEGR